MNKQEYEFHPYAEVFPMMTATEFRELLADMQGEHGQREPITLLDGKILDGRNRYKACRHLGIEPKVREFNGNGDPIDFIVSMNLRRRNLTESQKGLVAAKIANLERGRPKETAKTSTKPAEINPPRGGFTEAQAAKLVDTSERTVSRGKKVLKEASRRAIREIEAGKKTLGQVEKEIKETKAKEETAKTEHFDKTGYPIPPSILDDWKQAESFRSTLADLQRIKLSVGKALDASDLMFREIGQDTFIELNNAWSALKQVLPYAVCPTCQGRTRDKCTVCKQRGYVSEFAYRHWFAKDVIELRERSIKK